MNKFSELKIGSTIKLINSGETFTIDKIFDDNHVDMTATRPYNTELGFDWNERFFSIKLVNFEIIK